MYAAAAHLPNIYRVVSPHVGGDSLILVAWMVVVAKEKRSAVFVVGHYEDIRPDPSSGKVFVWRKVSQPLVIVAVLCVCTHDHGRYMSSLVVVMQSVNVSIIDSPTL